MNVHEPLPHQKRSAERSGSILCLIEVVSSTNRSAQCSKAISRCEHVYYICNAPQTLQQCSIIRGVTFITKLSIRQQIAGDHNVVQHNRFSLRLSTIGNRMWDELNASGNVVEKEAVLPALPSPTCCKRESLFNQNPGFCRGAPKLIQNLGPPRAVIAGGDAKRLGHQLTAGPPIPPRGRLVATG